MAEKIIIRPTTRQEIHIDTATIARTDEELERLKEEYRQKIAETAEAKLAYETSKATLDALAEDLEDVAQETTSQEIRQDVADVKTAVENIDFSTLAKQGSNINATNTAILEALSHIDIDTYDLAKEATLGAAPIGSDKNTVFQYLAAILDNIEGQGGEDIPEGLGDRINLLLQFFGLPEALPEIEVATEQEVKVINDDVMGALYGYGMVTVTIHSLMRTGSETTQNSQSSQDSESSQNSENAQNSAQSTGYVTQDLASVVYVDPSKTWAENGYPTLYDDEGTAIDTTTNPAAGDEVFNYQIQSES